jgi:hypothetical protein
MGTLATRKQSAAIRERMQSIRSGLPHAMDAAKSDVRELTKWQTVVRTFPLTSVAAVATTAFLLVPKKPPQLSRRDRLAIALHRHSRGDRSDSATDEQSGSLLGGLAGAAAAMAFRTGTTLVLRRLGNSLLGDGSSTAPRSSAGYRNDGVPS